MGMLAHSSSTKKQIYDFPFLDLFQSFNYTYSYVFSTVCIVYFWNLVLLLVFIPFAV